MPTRRSLSAVALLAATAALLAVPAGRADQALKGRICYSLKDGDAFALHIMDADGKNDRAIPNLPGRVSIMPSWSPDGKRIAFTSGETIMGKAFGVYVINDDGTGLRRLAENETLAAVPAWSPDGKTLLCTVERQDAPGLVAFDADGGGSREVPTGKTLSAFGFFSPDGKRIAFSGAVDKNNEMEVDIYVANADGTGAERVTMGGGFYIGSPGAWSPDGKTIAYVKANPKAETATLNVLVLADKQESQLFELKIGRDFFDSVPYPGWSADGKWMVICENVDGKGGIFRVSADGKTRERLTPAGVSAHSPAWSR